MMNLLEYFQAKRPFKSRERKTRPRWNSLALGHERLEPRRMLSASATNADLIYDTTTGNVRLDSSEAAGAFITNFVLKNSGSDFSFVTNSFPEELNGSSRATAGVSTSNEISWTDLEILTAPSWNSAPGAGQSLDLGEVFPAGLSQAQLLSLLTQRTYVGRLGSGIQNFDLILISSSPNQSPVFTAGADQMIDEDAGLQNIAGWAAEISPGSAGETGQSLTFQVTGNTNPRLFAFGPTVDPLTGTLNYTPATNAFGSANITLVLQDDGGTATGGSDTSDPQEFTIEISPVNDAPSFTKGSNPSVGENTGPRIISPWATNISPGAANESAQTLTFQITSNSNPALFSLGPEVDPATGDLSFTPAADAFGMATISLVLQDDDTTNNGGNNTSTQQVLTIAVNQVNDPPKLAGIPDVTISHEGLDQTIDLDSYYSDLETPTSQATFTVASSFEGVSADIDPLSHLLRLVAAEGFTGTGQIVISVTDGGSGSSGPLSAEDTFTVTVEPSQSNPAFQVAEFNATSSGFEARFNRIVDQSELNLYLDEPDVFVVGERVGLVRGSLVISVDGTRLSFVKTGGPLESDTYRVTIVSGSHALRDDLGQLLDGNGDGVSGDDFITSMIVEREDSPALSIPDFARGPGQRVAVPATAAGLPISLDDAEGVIGVNFVLRYDPSQLMISAVGPALQLPADWTVSSNITSIVEPGLLNFSAFGFTPLSGTDVKIVSLSARVPEDVSFAKAHVLRIEEVIVRTTEGIINSQGDQALQQTSFFGDADGDAFFTGFDASLIAGIIVGLKDGLSQNPSVDPSIIGNVTGRGSLNGLDASWIAQKSVGLQRPEIPDIPIGVTLPAKLAEDYTEETYQAAVIRRQAGDKIFSSDDSEDETLSLVKEYAGEENSLRGDINGDNVINAQDIDLLFSLEGQSPTMTTDLNSDEVISDQDVYTLVRDILNTELGDANLNGVINDADFNSVSGSFGALGSGWSGGDFNGDGLTDNSDFGVVLGNFGFEAAVAQVSLTIEADQVNHTWQAFAEVTNPDGALGIASFQINVIGTGGLSVLDNTVLQTGSTFPLFASTGSFGIDIHASQDTISNGGKGGFLVDDEFALNTRELLASGEFEGSQGVLILEANSISADFTGVILFTSSVDFLSVIQSTFADSVQSSSVTITP